MPCKPDKRPSNLVATSVEVEEEEEEQYGGAIGGIVEKDPPKSLELGNFETNIPQLPSDFCPRGPLLDPVEISPNLHPETLDDGFNSITMDDAEWAAHQKFLANLAATDVPQQESTSESESQVIGQSNSFPSTLRDVG